MCGGEGGVGEGGIGLRGDFRHWQVWASAEALDGGASVAGNRLFANQGPGQIVVRSDEFLHLPVSVRSYRAESVSAWVNAVVAGDAPAASTVASKVKEFPIVLTRVLTQAKAWLRESTRGFRRCGLLARSGALRLRAHGIEASSGFRGGVSFEESLLAPPGDLCPSTLSSVGPTQI